MKRSEIKVGEVYGVRRGRFDGYLGSEPVPARVLDLNAAVEGKLSARHPDGGVLVEFIEPTRVPPYSHGGFSLAKKTNENGGPITATFVFHDRRPGCGGSVGRCFVGLWSELKRERRDQARAEREAEAEDQRRADAFAPALDAYRKRLRKVGLRTDVHDDGSGLHGDVRIVLYTSSSYETRRATGFAHDDVEIAKPLFDQLIEIAERHGEKIKRGGSDGSTDE